MASPGSSPRVKAALQALFVTFLWSTSWVLIKIGLQEIPAVTFAGLRYFLAFLCLTPFFLHAGGHRAITGLPRRTWAHLLGLGLLLYTLTQGAQFVSWYHTLRTLSAVESSVINNSMMIQIPVLAVLFLGERLGGKEIAGLALAGVGVVLVNLFPGKQTHA